MLLAGAMLLAGESSRAMLASARLSCYDIVGTLHEADVCVRVPMDMLFDLLQGQMIQF